MRVPVCVEASPLYFEMVSHLLARLCPASSRDPSFCPQIPSSVIQMNAAVLTFLLFTWCLVSELSHHFRP